MIFPAGRVTEDRQRRGEADRGTGKVERLSKGGVFRDLRFALGQQFPDPEKEIHRLLTSVLFTFMVDTEALPYYH